MEWDWNLPHKKETLLVQHGTNQRSLFVLNPSTHCSWPISQAMAALWFIAEPPEAVSLLGRIGVQGPSDLYSHPVVLGT